MTNLTFSLLDNTDGEAVAHYERSLFRAFFPHYDAVFPLIWHIDREKRRLRSMIPYADQDIFIGRLNGAVIAGVSINYAVHKLLQLEMLGFTVDKTQHDICEGRALFSLQMFAGAGSVLARLGEFAYASLVRKHIKKIFGTCSPKMLRGYRHFGFTVIAEGTIMQRRRYLLEKAVERPFFK